VLVITRGFPGYICPYCSTQTSQLISNYEEFTKRDAEVLVVFPGDKKHIAQFLTQSRPEEPEPESDLPFPVLLDESFTAVDQLGIRGDRARPSTYILDKKGQVKFAYVGSSPSDRPSIAALLDILDTLED
jgi:peroxiredoxin